MMKEILTSVFLCLWNFRQLHELAQVIEESIGKVTIINKHEELLGLSDLNENTQSYILVTDHLDDTFKNVSDRFPVPLTVVFYTPQRLVEYIGWFKAFNIKNLVIQDENDFDHFHELIIALRKITTQDILGIEKYIPLDTQILQQSLDNSEQRYTVMDSVLDYMKSYVKNPKFLHTSKSVLEEMFMNAFYSAPVDEKNRQLFDQQDRAIPVQLPSEKKVVLSYAFDGKNLIFSVLDSYGSFNHRILVDSLILHFQNELAIKEGEGGAGLGLRYLFRNTSQLVVNIDRKRYTEVIAFLDISRRFSEFLRQPGSLNIFIK